MVYRSIQSRKLTTVHHVSSSHQAAIASPNDNDIVDMAGRSGSFLGGYDDSSTFEVAFLYCAGMFVP